MLQIRQHFKCFKFKAKRNHFAVITFYSLSDCWMLVHIKVSFANVIDCWEVVTASVGRVVAYDSRGPQFESCHRQKIYSTFTVNWIEKTKMKKKEAWNGPFKIVIDCPKDILVKFYFFSQLYRQFAAVKVTDIKGGQDKFWLILIMLKWSTKYLSSQ